MKRLFALILSFLMIIPGSIALAADGYTPPVDVVTKEEAYQFADDLKKLDEESYDPSSRIIVKSKKELKNFTDAIDTVKGLNDLYVLQYKDKNTADKAIEYYNNLSYVEYAEYDVVETTEAYLLNEEFENKIDTYSNENIDYSNYISQCDSTTNSNIDDAIKLLGQEKKNITDIKVGIIDTGINDEYGNYSNRILGRYSFYTNTSTAFDCLDAYGHGRMVAGIVLLNTPENVKLYGYKIARSNDDHLSSSEHVAAFYMAYADGCKVINCSWQSYSKAMEDAVNEITKQGCIVVQGAGNFGTSKSNRTFKNSISVGSSTEVNTISSFSEYGPGVDIYAPGNGIRYIDYDGDVTGFFKGTSAASPMVSSICAILCSFDQSLTVDEIRNALIETGISTVEENKSENRLIADAYGAAKYLFGKELKQVQPISYKITQNKENGNMQISFDCEEDATIFIDLGLGELLCTPYREETNILPQYKYCYKYEKDTVFEIDKSNVYTISVCAYAPGKAKSAVEHISIPAHTDESGFNLTKASKTQQYNMIDKYQLNEKVVTVPSEIDGCEIQEIGKYCFMGNQTVEKIILPASVKQIDKYAFANCPNLKEVIALGVEVCGMYAFYDSENLINVEMPNVSVANTGMFKNCTSLETAKLGTLTEIDNHAFYGCENLKLVKTTSDDISFAVNTFKDCNNLTIYTPENSSMETFAEKNNIPLLGTVTKNGASIRVTDAGLRFGYQYNGKDNKNIEEYGFVYNSGITDNLTVDNSLKLVANNRIDHGGYTTYNLVFTDVPKESYNQVVSAKAYIKFAGEYFYSDTVQHSFKSVAEAVLADDEIDKATKDKVSQLLQS